MNVGINMRRDDEMVENRLGDEECIPYKIWLKVSKETTRNRSVYGAGARRPCNGCKRRLHLQIK
jgi:hypothetical protein